MKVIKNTSQITIELDDFDLRILGNDLLDPLQWIEDAMIGKLNRCKKRLMRGGVETLLRKKSVENIPTDEDLLLDLILSQPEYKNRVERDKEVDL